MEKREVIHVNGVTIDTGAQDKLAWIIRDVKGENPYAYVPTSQVTALAESGKVTADTIADHVSQIRSSVKIWKG